MTHAAHGEGCRYTGIDREHTIEDLAAFHGHLGPYIVLGYRMGRFVKANFCSDPFQMKARVFCKGVPPESCLADGVQIASGCTLGKRNIEIIPDNEIRCEFSCADRKIVIRPKKMAFPPQGSEGYSLLIEKMAEDMYHMPESQLFTFEGIP
ncbi:MAG TPA: formylmethanofuran dehydrogenase subunit E family protein [Methanothrix sp.]|nr:formylmethanofuran dehydrogenase subunit E family protein [Methanothrix sp.]